MAYTPPSHPNEKVDPYHGRDTRRAASARQEPARPAERPDSHRPAQPQPPPPEDLDKYEDENQAPTRRGILNGRRLAAAVLAIVVLLGEATALMLNGSDDETASPSVDNRFSQEDGAPGGSGTAGDSDWEKVVPHGECQCADGSEFAFWERQADPTKFVFYHDGGAACVDATSCAVPLPVRPARALTTTGASLVRTSPGRSQPSSRNGRERRSWTATKRTAGRWRRTRSAWLSRTWLRSPDASRRTRT